MASIFLHEFPGRQWVFELSEPEFLTSQESAAASLTTAVEAFSSDLVTPFSADLSLGYVDAEFAFHVDQRAPVMPFWLFKSEDALAEIRLAPAWNPAIEQSVNSINSERLLEWIIVAMRSEEASSAGVRIGWRELLIRALRVRLPSSINEIGPDGLKINYGSHSFSHPIERIGDALFVSGPLANSSTGVPMDLRVTNDTGVLTFTVSVYWSLWTDSNQEGWPDLREALKRLQNIGWRLNRGEI